MKSINFPRRIQTRPIHNIITMSSPKCHGDEGSATPMHGADETKPGSDHTTEEVGLVDTTVTTTTICEDASLSSSEQDDEDSHGDNTDEIRRLHSLVDHHKSRASRLETENTTLRLDLANVRFDLEHCRLELRQMTTKRDALRKEVFDALNSKAALAQNLGRENSEMISTIDKLETERDVLLEEVEKLRDWIIKNKGEGDDDIDEEGDWVATGPTNIFRNNDSDGLIGLGGQILKNKGDTSTSQEEAWEAGRIPQFPSTLHSNKSKEDEFASGGASTSTPLTTADTFDSKEDRLYSDEYLSLAGTEDDSDEDDEDNDEAFQKSYHGTTRAGQSTGQDDSTIGSVDTTGKETADTVTSNEVTKKKKKKRWGVSVKPRRRGSVPTSPNCVSQS